MLEKDQLPSPGANDDDCMHANTTAVVRQQPHHKRCTISTHRHAGRCGCGPEHCITLWHAHVSTKGDCVCKLVCCACCKNTRVWEQLSGDSRRHLVWLRQGCEEDATAPTPRHLQRTVRTVMFSTAWPDSSHSSFGRRSTRTPATDTRQKGRTSSLVALVVTGSDAVHEESFEGSGLHTRVTWFVYLPGSKSSQRGCWLVSSALLPCL